MTLTLSLDDIDVPIFVVDVEPGPRFRIFGMNRAAEKEIGQASESLAGQLFEDCLPPHKARMLTDRYAVCVRSRQSMHFDEIGEMSPNQDWYRTTLSPCLDVVAQKVVQPLPGCLSAEGGVGSAGVVVVDPGAHGLCPLGG
ncbi:PAS domain-containing protein [Methylobacterium sp. E-041]|nr:PAS domain-containing protein [Methylobacterium sp. E-041]